MQIEAAVAREKFSPLNLERLDLEEPRHDEVRVRLVASGVCHTDMAIRDQVIPMPQPIVLGHEGAGIIAKVGASVAKVKVGKQSSSVETLVATAPAAKSVCRPIAMSSFNAISAAGARMERHLSPSMEKKCTLLWVKAHSPPCRLPRPQRDQSGQRCAPRAIGTSRV